MTYCPPRSTILQNLSPIARTMVEICVTKFFQFLALGGGPTPGPQLTKRGDDLTDSEFYHSAKFHRSTPTHARDIPYKKSCGHTHTHTHTHTNKQTVNDISTTCLSACVDKNRKLINIVGITAVSSQHTGLILTRYWMIGRPPSSTTSQRTL